MNSLNYSFYFNLTKNNIKILNLEFFPCDWWYPPSILSFLPAHSRGGQYIGKRYFENRLKFDITIRFSLGT